jgi:hypothetical protein
MAVRMMALGIGEGALDVSGRWWEGCWGARAAVQADCQAGVESRKRRAWWLVSATASFLACGFGTSIIGPEGTARWQVCYHDHGRRYRAVRGRSRGESGCGAARTGVTLLA